MDYLLCIPARETNTRENCEKIHNVLARMSDTYKLRIVPEPVKNKQFPCPPYYKKYRIYKPVKERDTNGEAYLEKEEEGMILHSCKTEDEQELMKNCIYAYQYSAAIVLKSFREKEKKNKMQVRPLSERTQAAKGAGNPTRGGRPGVPERAEKPEQGWQECPSGSDRPERSDRAYRNRPSDRAAEGAAERAQGRERNHSERERSARVSSAERTADRRSGNRTVMENEKREERQASGRRDRFERRSPRRGDRSEAGKNEIVRDRVQEITPIARSNDAPVQEALPFRAQVETGSLPAFRDTAATVTAQPMQRKREGYAPMERKSAAQQQKPDQQV